MHTGRFTLRSEHEKEILQHAQDSFPLECCGYVGAKNGQSELVIPVKNALQSPNKFFMDPEEQLSALKLLEQKNLETAAIYHSHPDGASHLSESDIEAHPFHGALMILCYCENQSWKLRCFSLDKGKVIDLKCT